jgi:uncharacterized protein YkwD
MNLNKIIWLALICMLLSVTACANPGNTSLPIQQTSTATTTIPATEIPASSPTATDTPHPTATPTNTPTAHPSETPLPAYASEVIALVNQERDTRSLPALTINTTLMTNAESWSIFMAENDVFHHSEYTVGENVGAGYPTPEEVVAGWMDSPGHRANILSESFTQVGAGYAYSSDSTYKHYWTLQFSP